MSTERKKCWPGCCKQCYEKERACLRCHHKRQAQSWCAVIREPEWEWTGLAGEEAVELKRASKANTNNVMCIDICSKTRLATQIISQVALPWGTNHTPWPKFHPHILPSRSQPIPSQGPLRGPWLSLRPINPLQQWKCEMYGHPKCKYHRMT